MKIWEDESKCVNITLEQDGVAINTTGQRIFLTDNEAFELAGVIAAWTNRRIKK